MSLTSRAQWAAKNLFLRNQLALYQERRTKPRRPDPATRVALVVLSRLLDWRSILTVVKPDTLIRWHRQGWRLFWRRKSRSGRRPIPVGLRRLIIAMAPGEPDLGRGADRGRTAPEARTGGLTAHGRTRAEGFRALIHRYR
jgi:hypothetical protein